MAVPKQRFVPDHELLNQAEAVLLTLQASADSTLPAAEHRAMNVGNAVEILARGLDHQVYRLLRNRRLPNTSPRIMRLKRQLQADAYAQVIRDHPELANIYRRHHDRLITAGCIYHHRHTCGRAPQ
jgi:hypothetical protein